MRLVFSPVSEVIGDDKRSAPAKTENARVNRIRLTDQMKIDQKRDDKKAEAKPHNDHTQLEPEKFEVLGGFWKFFGIYPFLDQQFALFMFGFVIKEPTKESKEREG